MAFNLQISVYAVSVCLVFLVTLSLFPAVCSSIKSTVKYPDESIWTGNIVAIVTIIMSSFLGKLFDTLVCFLIFNSSDFAGRYLANWSKIMVDYIYLQTPFLNVIMIVILISLPRLVDGVLCY